MFRTRPIRHRLKRLIPRLSKLIFRVTTTIKLRVSVNIYLFFLVFNEKLSAVRRPTPRPRLQFDRNWLYSQCSRGSASYQRHGM